jgi:uncharacterized protein YlaI
MNSKSRDNKICAYCGCANPETKDHVPPKSLFQKPLPNNLITVPTCQNCHSRISIDDEYFLMALGIVLSGDEGKKAVFITEKIKRALKRPEANKLRLSFRNSAKPIELHSDAGIYLGNRYAIPFDWKRIKNFAKRILIGLYFYELDIPVPQEYEVAVRLSWLSEDSSVLEAPEVKEILAILRRSKNISIGNNHFQYWVAKCDDDPLSSFWYVRIAEEFGFMGFVNQPDQLTSNS